MNADETKTIPDATPRYGMNAMIRKTGLTLARLRVWESRYGLPMPVRTAFGKRLYSDADVARVAAMQKLISDGTAHAQAAEIVKSLDRNGENR